MRGVMFFRFCLLLLCSQVLLGKETQVSLSATHNLAYIGDRVGVTLLVKSDLGVDDIAVKLVINEKNCALVKEGEITRRIVPEGIVLEQKYELAFFDLGEFEIGPAQVTLFSQGEKKAELISNEVPISVKKILKNQKTELEPGKPPIFLSGSPKYLIDMLWLPVLIGAALLGLWLVYRKNKRVIAPQKILLTPLQKLQQELKRLFEERLYEKGFQVLFSLKLTHSLKKFIRGWHRFDAEEMTTEEIRAKLFKFVPDSPAIRALIRIFESADLVKFACYELNPTEYEDMCRQIEVIVSECHEVERKRAEEMMAQNGVGNG